MYLMKIPQFDLKDPSFVSLLLSNFATIAMALIFDWSLAIVLWIYWFQSVSIGIVNVFRILLIKGSKFPEFKFGIFLKVMGVIGKLFTAAFFTVHFGLFHFVYAIFLATLFSAGITAYDFTYIALAGLLFFVSHLISFIIDEARGKEETDMGRAMFRPYARIVPMHLTIIFGSVLLSLTTTPKVVLVFFLLLKTAADLAMHFSEHRGGQKKQGTFI